ncbi:MAG: tandem-95 repeat protein, partial [bacterium]
LTVSEGTATALSAGSFGYADPNSVALAEVRITTLPVLGTLKFNGTAVSNDAMPLTVAAANIGTLTYQPPLYGYGTPYTTMGIKVKNANNVWSIADAVMTVNVTHVNHPPTSAGAGFNIKGDSVKTFWKTDFPFADVDAGERLSAIKITSLPAHGTLKLAGTTISAVPSAAIPVANIGTLTYTPNTGYVGSDPFNYQVSDGADFSADAIMAITVKSPYGIDVLNGSFENPDPVLVNGSYVPWSDGTWAFIPSPWTANMGNYGRVKRTGTTLPALTNGGTWIANMTDAGFDVITQDLLTSVGAGDTLSVTFYVGRDSLGSGLLQASFMVDGTAYSQTIDTSTQTANTWKSYTLQKTIIEPGNLSLRFSNVSGRAGWLDNISNVTITPAVIAPGAPSSINATLTAVGDTATALAASNFGYSDPSSVALATVQIVSLPELGTLKYNGTAVSNSALPLTVAAASIGNLTYLSALNGRGTPYTRMGVMVKNANNLWSLPAWMTVNVTPLNHAPTSTGGSAVLKPNTVKTFAAANFPFSDVDAGDTLGAIQMVTSLPAHGTLKLSGTPITSVPSAAIPVASIGTLTYTPAADYIGPDSFKFQVRDAALFSADATMTITVTPDILVQNGSFETTGAVTDANWAHIAPIWNPSPDSDYGQSHAGVFFGNAADGTWYASFTNSGFSITQDLLATVNAGDILSVTFHAGKDTAQPGVITATFLVGSTPYSQNFDTSSQGVGTWAPYTLTKTLANAGNLSLRFSSVSGRAWLDKISNIAVTPTNAPFSTNATLTTLEDTPAALAAGNFGYADPNSAALAAVQITTLPALGTLTLSGSPVASGALPLTVAAADIGSLTYQPAANGNGAPYATIGIKVMNANNLWSIADAVMTVNVTPVNDVPTSTGASAILPTGTDKTFAAGDFPFADVDAGDALSAIRVTSLPAHGTLNLNGTPIISVPGAAIPVATIGNLTYTPAINYSGPDSFNFQVRDATAFSADANMAITVIYAKYIAVQNGSFEVTNPGDQTWTDGNWMFIPSPWTTSMGGYGRLKYSSAPVGFPTLTGGGTWMANMMNSGNWINQNLGTQSFSAGDILSVTFYVGRDSSGSGVLQASFLVGATTYSQTFDTTNQAVNTWQSYTLTQTIPTGVTANLSLKFRNVSGVAGWLDKISNVSVMSSSGPPAITGGTLSGALSTTYGTASSPATFTLSGTNMSAGILVTAPAGFEVSKFSGSGYATTTTVGVAGTIASTSVYVRLSATAPVSGAYNSQNIVLSSSGATSVNVTTTASGNTVNKATPTATLTVNNSPATYDGSPKSATAGIAASSVPGAVQNILTGGAATQTAAATYAVTADFVPADTTNYNTLAALSAGNFIIDIGVPASTNATLAAVEDTATALSTNNFGYFDPNPFPLAAVRITSLPALGTLKLGGTDVTNNAIVAAADITNLTYQAALNEAGTPYTTMGIKVMNASNVWSLAAVMTVNVTPVNDAPASAGGSVIVIINTAKAFASINFPFSDADVGDALAAVKVISLPAHGTLSVGMGAEVPVAGIGSLTYTPASNYTGADAFKFQVGDGTAFSADATMAITVTSCIPVLNGSFETGTGGNTVPPWTGALNRMDISGGPQWFSTTTDGLAWGELLGWNNSFEQSLNTVVSAGEKLSVTFCLGIQGDEPGSPARTGEAYFKVDKTEYAMPYDLAGQAKGAWTAHTMTRSITNTGLLSLGFRSVNNGVVWVDNISNVSVMPRSPSGTVILLR